MELSIDTSTRYAGLCLSEQGESLTELTWRSERNHTVELSPRVELILERNGAKFSDLTGLIIAQGPGNFSALRVGISYAKGLAFSLQIPLVAINTLKVEATPYMNMNLPVYALLDAGRNEVVWSCFGKNMEGTPKSVDSIEDLCKQMKVPAILCGEILPRHHESIETILPSGIHITTVTLPSRRPSILASLGHTRLINEDYDDVATLQPEYARAPNISQPKPPTPIQ